LDYSIFFKKRQDSERKQKAPKAGGQGAKKQINKRKFEQKTAFMQNAKI